MNKSFLVLFFKKEPLAFFARVSLKAVWYHVMATNATPLPDSIPITIALEPYVAKLTERFAGAFVRTGADRKP